MINLKKKKGMEEKVEKKIVPPRLTRDLLEVEKELPKSVPQALLKKGKESIMSFEVQYTPDSSTYWYGGKYIFAFEVLEDYPVSAPLVMCKTKIYHPNIDYNGNVCLNILKEAWTPSFTILNLITGVYQLFIVPNPMDPLNHDVAKLMRDDLNQFKANVKKTLRGGYYFGQDFPRFT